MLLVLFLLSFVVFVLRLVVVIVGANVVVCIVVDSLSSIIADDNGGICGSIACECDAQFAVLVLFVTAWLFSFFCVGLRDFVVQFVGVSSDVDVLLAVDDADV